MCLFLMYRFSVFFSLAGSGGGSSSILIAVILLLVNVSVDALLMYDTRLRLPGVFGVFVTVLLLQLLLLFIIGLDRIGATWCPLFLRV